MPSYPIPSTRAQAITDELRRLIISGEFRPGTSLRQAEIAQRFAVSTTPVREAFTSLAREGFLTQDAHRGVFVLAPSAADIRENYEIRAALESLAAERAAAGVTSETLERLDAMLEEMRTRGKEDSVYQASVLNPAFHELIYSAADRPRLLDLITSLRQAAVAYQAVSIRPDFTVPADYVDDVQAEHEEIVAALHARSPKRAARAVRSHIAHNLEMVLSLIADRPADPHSGGV